MKTKKAYICSPLSASSPEGIKENMRMANQYAKEISRILDCRAAAVHGVLPKLLDDNDPAERKLALDFGKKYLATCDMLVVCGNRVSPGMAGEIKAASEHSIPIFVYVNGKVYAFEQTRRYINGGSPSFVVRIIFDLLADNAGVQVVEGIDLNGL